jgi:hypothetical protein
MNRKVGVGAIVVGLCALAVFCYYLYRVNNPPIQGAYNAKYGPPAYARGKLTRP